MEDGLKKEVLIEDHYFPGDTGLRTLSRMVTIWAPIGMEAVIKETPGVEYASKDHRGSGTKYTAFLDPRYDREWVLAEVEARIKIEAGG